MAKTLKNESDLKKLLLSKCEIAIKKVANSAYEEVKERTVDWYGDYTPVDGGYQRTYQLHGEDNEKFIIRESYSSNNGYEEVIKLDTNGIYNTGKNPTKQQVVDTAAQGLHGVKDGDGWKYVGGNAGVKLWDEGLQEKATKDLVDALIAQGVSIKKG